MFLLPCKLFLLLCFNIGFEHVNRKINCSLKAYKMYKSIILHLFWANMSNGMAALNYFIYLLVAIPSSLILDLTDSIKCSVRVGVGVGFLNLILLTKAGSLSFSPTGPDCASNSLTVRKYLFRLTISSCCTPVIISLLLLSYHNINRVFTRWICRPQLRARNCV